MGGGLGLASVDFDGTSLLSNMDGLKYPVNSRMPPDPSKIMNL